MPAAVTAIFSKEIFRFFADLKRNNKKTWMDANRERYQATVCKPFRRLLEELSPALLKLDANFDVAVEKMESFCERLSAWLYSNKLIAHEEKTKLMLFTAKSHPILPDIMFNNKRF